MNCKLRVYEFGNKVFILMLNIYPSFSQGLILSNALRAQKNFEDESYTIAHGNLRSELIQVRNEALEKDKILISLVNKVKEDEAKYNAQAEAHKAEVEDLQKKLVEANENCAVAKASQEISEWWKTKLEKILRSFADPRKYVLKNPWIV
jgi:phage host-nuclease inhibitor protein Gam